jgi:hypothetical protein
LVSKSTLTPGERERERESSVINCGSQKIVSCSNSATLQCYKAAIATI